MRSDGKKWMAAICAVAVAGMCSMAVGQVVWTDDFDSYSTGPLTGGGWEGWDNSSAAIGEVTDEQSQSPRNSAVARNGTDAVRQFTDVVGGTAVFSCYQYVESSHTGIGWFILLNTYNHGGPYLWSTQLGINYTGFEGKIVSTWENVALDLIYDQWVEIRVEIDFENDEQVIFYDNQELSRKSWKDGVSTGGAAQLQCVDLWSDTSSGIYYDDFELSHTPPDPGCGIVLETLPTMIAGSNATFRVSGPPGMRVALLYSLSPGSRTISAMGWCFELGIAVPGDPRDQLVGQGVIPAGGTLDITKRIPGAARGKRAYIQAVGQGSCPNNCQSDVRDGLIG